MSFAERQELILLQLGPEETEAIRIRWCQLHPDQSPEDADKMTAAEAIALLEEVRARKAEIEREALGTLVHATRSVGKGNDRRSAVLVWTILKLLLLVGVTVGLLVWLQSKFG